ncbi:MAG: MBL fold metallo-hydrolase [bacterium]|nr:MBL fold metallo-hydrolase [bacterium]
MKVKVLSSGSKGNCTYIETTSLKILIDIGTTYQYLASELEKINITTHDLDFVLITHTHSDHIKGLQSLVKKTNLKVYITPGMISVLQEKIPLENLRNLEETNIFNDLKIDLIHTSHDVESVGYILESNNKSLIYITDTGYVNKKYIPRLTNKNLYIIESNHDEKMLMNGPYPYVLKQRVISDKGHLSNHATAKLLKEVVGPSTERIILAHISEHNNTEKLAYEYTKKELEKKQIAKEIMIAKQNESLEMIEV